MDIIENQGRLIDDINSRLDRAESLQKKHDSRLKQFETMFYNREMQLENVYQKQMENDVIPNGPIISEFINSNPDLKFGCIFSSHQYCNAI